MNRRPIMTPPEIKWTVRVIFAACAVALIAVWSGPQSSGWDGYDAVDLAVTLSVWATVELAVWKRGRRR